MTDENGVNQDAQTVTVTDIFLAGGLRVQALGDCLTKVKQAASKGQWARVEDLNKNETQLRADEVLAMIVSEGHLLKREIQQPVGPAPAGEFKPVAMP